MLQYFWTKDQQLKINGEILPPRMAYKKYPGHALELQLFVYEKMHPSTVSTEAIAMQKKINQKIRQIFHELEIKPCGSDLRTQVTDVFKLFSYVVKNSYYDEHIMAEKAHETCPLRETQIRDVYRCLIENRSVCSSDAETLSLLYNQYGLDSRCIIIANKKDTAVGVHEVVGVQIGHKEFISDPTTVRSTFESKLISNLYPGMALINLPHYFNQIMVDRKIVCVFPPFNLQNQSRFDRLKHLIDFPKKMLRQLTTLNQTDAELNPSR